MTAEHDKEFQGSFFGFSMDGVEIGLFSSVSGLSLEFDVAEIEQQTKEGKKIVKYCGVTAGEAILGANVFKDLFASVRDIVGGRSATYEKELQRARDIALTELQERGELQKLASK